MSTSTKSIFQLIPDIYHLVGKKDGWFNHALASDMGKEIALKMQSRFSSEERKNGLRLSKMGDCCPCSLWHSVNKPELAEPIPPWVQIKFMYGELVESLVIALAKATGHEVTGEQDALSVDGIVGHRDCIIDGCLVDVKSTNKFGIATLEAKRVSTDTFMSAYLEQLDGYLAGSLDDSLLREKSRGYILGVDKQLGHMALYEHELRSIHIRQRIKDFKEIVALPHPPKCSCGVVPDGQSGNLKLDLKASYNNFKHCCFPNLRTFLYSDGPRYLVKVVKQPKNSQGPITEIDKLGKVVYNA